jgi:hypothetical protein
MLQMTKHSPGPSMLMGKLAAGCEQGIGQLA